MTSAFIADLHLSPTRPDITAAFCDFCQQHQHLESLYILGDLFDAWLGDDDPSDFAQQIKAPLKQLSHNGVKLYFLPGNRDFMLGTRFASDVGLTLLEDETVINLNGQPTLLMHGDTLCTADTGYLKYRAIIQHPITRYVLKNLPLTWRMRIARKLRQGSQSQRPQLSHEQLQRMDVQQDAVIEVMRRHKVYQLIHGHTHRAAIHQFMVDDNDAKRIVLGDWYDAQRLLDATHYSGIYCSS